MYNYVLLQYLSTTSCTHCAVVVTVATVYTVPSSTPCLFNCEPNVNTNDCKTIPHSVISRYVAVRVTKVPLPRVERQPHVIEPRQECDSTQNQQRNGAP